jgi:hypothetical protein
VNDWFSNANESTLGFAIFQMIQNSSSSQNLITLLAIAKQNHPNN